MSQEIHRRLDAALSAIERAQRALDAGEIVDLGPLAQLAAEMADLSSRVDAAEAAALRPRILALLADLNQLDAALRGAHRALKEQLGETGARERAITAYGRPSGR